MSELTNALGPLFVKEEDKLAKAKRVLLGAINIVAEFFPSDWDDNRREAEMANLMAYYNNFEELMAAKGMTIDEYKMWAAKEVGYL